MNKDSMIDRQIRFLRTHADQRVMDTTQMNLYLTICKMLVSELRNRRL